MTLIVLGLALRRIGIGAACIAALLVCAGVRPGLGAPAGARDREFIQAAAGIGARLQTLRHFEKQMLAHGSGAGRAGLYREKRASERHRIDELSLVARASARRPEEHSRIDALTRLVARADARFDFLTQLNYGETQ